MIIWVVTCRCTCQWIEMTFGDAICSECIEITCILIFQVPVWNRSASSWSLRNRPHLSRQGQGEGWGGRATSDNSCWREWTESKQHLKSDSLSSSSIYVGFLNSRLYYQMECLDSTVLENQDSAPEAVCFLHLHYWVTFSVLTCSFI